MKLWLRRTVALLIVSMFSISLYSANLQKTYMSRDEVYQRVERLTREAGVLGPSSFSPVSGRALQIALDRIDVSELNQFQLQEFNALYDEIVSNFENNTLYQDGDFFSFDLGIGINFGANLEDYDSFDYTNQKVDHRNDDLIPYRYREETFSLYPKVYFGDNVYLEADFSIKNNNRRNYESSFGWIITGANGRVSVLGNGYANTYAPELPYHAGLSIGNDYIHFVLGRYPHSIGNGITGNLLVGDNFIYQEISNLSFISNHFTYNISITRFDQMDNLDNKNQYGTFSRSEFDGMQQFRVVHRFDLTLFDVFRFAIDLGTIYNSIYGFDIRFFYPFVLGHNYYNYTNYLTKETFDEANNTMTFSAELVLIKGLTIGVQAIVDQMQVYFENQTSVPSAWGLLANIKYSKSISEKGNMDLWTEFAYTNPYLYLNGKRDGEVIDFNLDYIVGYHTKHVQDYGYSGYQFGPDTILFALGGSWTDASGWEVGMKALYRIQGQKRLGNTVVNMNQTNIDMSESVIEESVSDYISNSTPTGGVQNAEHLLQFTATGSYTFRDYNIELFLACGVSTYFNYCFDKNNVQCFPQATIGVKWTGLNPSWFD